MCDGNMTPIPITWSSTGQRMNPDYAQKRTCRSFDALKEWTKKREQVLHKNEELDEATKQLMELMENPDVTNNLRSDKIANMNYLKETHGVTDQQVSQLYEYGQFLYSMGDYDSASQHLVGGSSRGPVWRAPDQGQR